MSYAYDDSNIFARILRGEIPNRTILQSEHSLAFHDIHPQAPVHALVIPKGRYVNFDHFALEATVEEIVDFHRMSGQVIALLGVQPGEGQDGYRIITNAGAHGMQEVPHYHIHILGGRILGRLIDRAI